MFHPLPSTVDHDALTMITTLLLSLSLSFSFGWIVSAQS